MTVVTKGGTNELHGDVFEYFRDKSLNTRNVFETTKPDYRRNQFGGSLGGPILQNRWQYFATLERTQTDEFFTVNTGKPQFYSSVEGTFPKPSHTNLYLVRSDAQLSPTQSLFVRYAQEDEKRTCFTCGGNNAANAGYDQAIPRRAVVVGHTWTPSPNRLNDFRFQFAYAEYQIAPAGTPIATSGQQSGAIRQDSACVSVPEPHHTAVASMISDRRNAGSSKMISRSIEAHTTSNLGPT